jgi:hypothetical protein
VVAPKPPFLLEGEMLGQKETELISEFLVRLEEIGLKKIELNVNENRFNPDFGPSVLVTLRLARKMNDCL